MAQTSVTLRFVYTRRAKLLLWTYRLLAELGFRMDADSCARALVAQCRIETA